MSIPLLLIVKKRQKRGRQWSGKKKWAFSFLSVEGKVIAPTFSYRQFSQGIQIWEG